MKTTHPSRDPARPHASSRADADARPTLVLIHGLHSSTMEFGLLTRTLRARGVTFELLEIPGYTNADGRASDGAEWVRLAGDVLDARFGDGAPIVLGGLCVGGMVAAALVLAPRRQHVVGLALMSPTFAYDGWSIGRMQRLRKLAYALRIDRWITVREREPFGIRNLRTRQWVMQELANHGASAVGPARLRLRGIRESERLYATVAARFAQIEVPMLVLHARDDEVATVASVEAVVATATAPVRLVVLERSFHMITIDDDRQRVADELADFAGAPARTQVAPERSRRHPRAASLPPRVVDALSIPANLEHA